MFREQEVPMELLTTPEATEKWGISKRRVFLAALPFWLKLWNYAQFEKYNTLLLKNDAEDAIIFAVQNESAFSEKYNLIQKGATKAWSSGEKRKEFGAWFWPGRSFFLLQKFVWTNIIYTVELCTREGGIQQRGKTLWTSMTWKRRKTWPLNGDWLYGAYNISARKAELKVQWKKVDSGCSRLMRRDRSARKAGRNKRDEISGCGFPILAIMEGEDMPTLNWIGKKKVVTHHLDVLFRFLRKQSHYSDEDGTWLSMEMKGTQDLKAHTDYPNSLKSWSRCNGIFAAEPERSGWYDRKTDRSGQRSDFP